MERLVEIKHPYCHKSYWFIAPESLGEINIDDIVLCDTKMGDSIGRVISEPIVAENVFEIAERLGATFPLKGIKQVCGKVIRNYIYNDAKWDTYFAITSSVSGIINKLKVDKNV